MTVTAQEARREYQGNGTTKTFAFPYQFFEADDLDVWTYDVDGVGHYKILNTDYTVSGTLNPSGGSITFVNAPLSTDKVIIINDLDIKQVNHYINSDDFPAQSHEQALDRLTKICQRLADRIDRTVRAADYTPSDQVPTADTLEEMVDEAEAAADGANTSATAAAQAAAQSQTYRDASASYAANAANSATAAGNSATAAAGSATQAANSAAAAQVAEVDWKGPWSAATTYMLNDAVNLNGSSYISNKDNNLNHAPPNAAFWDVLALKGNDGSGTGTGDMLRANNLSDVLSVATSRTNLGLGNAATKDVGTAAGTVMAGDDSRIAGAAPLASPVFTGDPRAPTPATADNDTSIATTAFVKAQGYGPVTNWGLIETQLNSGSDLNAINPAVGSGSFSVSSPVNGPGVAGETWYHILHRIFDAVPSYVVQEATTLTIQPPQTFRRTKVVAAGGTWSGWYRVMDQSMIASAAQFRANVAGLLLTTDQTWAAAAPVALTTAPAIDCNMATGIDFYVTLNQAGHTFKNPTAMRAGQKGVIYILQDGVGGRTITTWENLWKFPAGVKPVLTAAANAQDVLSYVYTGAQFDCFFSADMK